MNEALLFALHITKQLNLERKAISFIQIKVVFFLLLFLFLFLLVLVLRRRILLHRLHETLNIALELETEIPNDIQVTLRFTRLERILCQRSNT